MIEVKDEDVLVYARSGAGQTTAEGFAMRPGVPVVAGKDVTLEFAQQLVDSGSFKIDVKEESKDKETEEPDKDLQTEDPEEETTVDSEEQKQ